MNGDGSKRAWWQSWIGILVGIGTLCTMILGAITFLYTTFPTHKTVAMADERVEVMVSELSEQTIKSFKSINKTNEQMQASIKRNSLRYIYDRLMDEKYRIMKLLKENPNDEELQKDLEKSKSRIAEVEKQLQNLK